MNRGNGEGAFRCGEGRRTRPREERIRGALYVSSSLYVRMCTPLGICTGTRRALHAYIYVYICVRERCAPPLGDINFSARAFVHLCLPTPLATVRNVRREPTYPPPPTAHAPPRTLRVVTFGGHFKPSTPLISALPLLVHRSFHICSEPRSL